MDLPLSDRVLTRAEVTLLLALYFPRDAVDRIADIAMLESGYHTGAWNQSGEDSRGLLQINIQAWPDYGAWNLFDPQLNCYFAGLIYGQQGYAAWYNSARTLGLI